MLKGNLYSLMDGKEAESISNYNRAVLEAGKKSANFKKYYANKAKAKIALVKLKLQ